MESEPGAVIPDPNHRTQCTCKFCTRLKAKSIPDQQWRDNHLPHLPPNSVFGIEPFPHPSNTWFWRVCPCGARHLTSDGIEGPAQHSPKEDEQ